MSSQRWLKERSMRVESTGLCGKASLPRVLMCVRDVSGWANPLFPETRWDTLWQIPIGKKSRSALFRPACNAHTLFFGDYKLIAVTVCHSSLKLLLKGQAMAVSKWALLIQESPLLSFRSAHSYLSGKHLKMKHPSILQITFPPAAF